MSELLGKALQKVPAKTVAIVFSATFLALCAVLVAVTAIVINTRRSVQLWPPKIGSDPEFVTEVAALKAEVTKVVQYEQTLRGTIIAAAMSTRQKAIEEIERGRTEAAKLMLEAADATAQQIKDSDSRVSESLKSLDQRVSALQAKL